MLGWFITVESNAAENSPQGPHFAISKTRTLTVVGVAVAVRRPRRATMGLNRIVRYFYFVTWRRRTDVKKCLGE
jgi:hypothetical protein